MERNTRVISSERSFNSVPPMSFMPSPDHQYYGGKQPGSLFVRFTTGDHKLTVDGATLALSEKTALAIVRSCSWHTPAEIAIITAVFGVNEGDLPARVLTPEWDGETKDGVPTGFKPVSTHTFKSAG